MQSSDHINNYNEEYNNDEYNNYQLTAQPSFQQQWQHYPHYFHTNVQLQQQYHHQWYASHYPPHSTIPTLPNYHTPPSLPYLPQQGINHPTNQQLPHHHHNQFHKSHPYNIPFPSPWLLALLTTQSVLLFNLVTQQLVQSSINLSLYKQALLDHNDDMHINDPIHPEIRPTVVCGGQETRKLFARHTTISGKYVYIEINDRCKLIYDIYEFYNNNSGVKSLRHHHRNSSQLQYVPPNNSPQYHHPPQQLHREVPPCPEPTLHKSVALFTTSSPDVSAKTTVQQSSSSTNAMLQLLKTTTPFPTSKPDLKSQIRCNTLSPALPYLKNGQKDKNNAFANNVPKNLPQHSLCACPRPKGDLKPRNTNLPPHPFNMNTKYQNSNTHSTASPPLSARGDTSDCCLRSFHFDRIDTLIHSYVEQKIKQSLSKGGSQAATPHASAQSTPQQTSIITAIDHDTSEDEGVTKNFSLDGLRPVHAVQDEYAANFSLKSSILSSSGTQNTQMPLITPPPRSALLLPPPQVPQAPHPQYHSNAHTIMTDEIVPRDIITVSTSHPIPHLNTSFNQSFPPSSALSQHTINRNTSNATHSTISEFADGKFHLPEHIRVQIVQKLLDILFLQLRVAKELASTSPAQLHHKGTQLPFVANSPDKNDYVKSSPSTPSFDTFVTRAQALPQPISFLHRPPISSLHDHTPQLTGSSKKNLEVTKIPKDAVLYTSRHLHRILELIAFHTAQSSSHRNCSTKNFQSFGVGNVDTPTSESTNDHLSEGDITKPFSSPAPTLILENAPFSEQSHEINVVPLMGSSPPILITTTTNDSNDSVGPNNDIFDIDMISTRFQRMTDEISKNDQPTQLNPFHIDVGHTSDMCDDIDSKSSVSTLDTAEFKKRRISSSSSYQQCKTCGGIIPSLSTSPREYTPPGDSENNINVVPLFDLDHISPSERFGEEQPETLHKHSHNDEDLREIIFNILSHYDHVLALNTRQTNQSCFNKSLTTLQGNSFSSKTTHQDQNNSNNQQTFFPSFHFPNRDYRPHFQTNPDTTQYKTKNNQKYRNSATIYPKQHRYHPYSMDDHHFHPLFGHSLIENVISPQRVQHNNAMANHILQTQQHNSWQSQQVLNCHQGLTIEYRGLTSTNHSNSQHNYPLQQFNDPLGLNSLSTNTDTNFPTQSLLQQHSIDYYNQPLSHVNNPPHNSFNATKNGNILEHHASNPPYMTGTPQLTEIASTTTDELVDKDEIFYQCLIASAVTQEQYQLQYRELRRLGRGASGEVTLVEHFVGGSELGYSLGYFAIKKISIGTGKYKSRETVERVMREVRTGELLSHRNCIVYRHSWLQLKENQNLMVKVPSLYILMQYCELKGLEQCIYPKSDEWVALKYDHETKDVDRTFNSNIIHSLRLPVNNEQLKIKIPPLRENFYTFAGNYPMQYSLSHLRPQLPMIETRLSGVNNLTNSRLVLSTNEMTILHPASHEYHEYIKFITSLALQSQPHNTSHFAHVSTPEQNFHNNNGTFHYALSPLIHQAPISANNLSNPPQFASTLLSSNPPPQLLRENAPIVLTEDILWIIFIDICLGLQHLHKHGIAHRDLKLENVLLTDESDLYSKYQLYLNKIISDRGNKAVHIMYDIDKTQSIKNKEKSRQEAQSMKNRDDMANQYYNDVLQISCSPTFSCVYTSIYNLFPSTAFHHNHLNSTWYSRMHPHAIDEKLDNPLMTYLACHYDVIVPNISQNDVLSEQARSDSIKFRNQLKKMASVWNTNHVSRFLADYRSNSQREPDNNVQPRDITPHYSPHFLNRFSHAVISDFGAATQSLLASKNQFQSNFDAHSKHGENMHNQSKQDIDDDNDNQHDIYGDVFGSGTLQYHSIEVLYYNGIVLLKNYFQQLENGNEDRESELSQRVIELENALSVLHTQLLPDKTNGFEAGHKFKNISIKRLKTNLHQPESEYQQDIWSLGITFYVMAFQIFPFSPTKQNDDLYGMILSLAQSLQPGSQQFTHSISYPVYPVSMPTGHRFVCPRSLSLQLMINFILTPDPSKRPSIDAILEHPIVKVHDFAKRL